MKFCPNCHTIIGNEYRNDLVCVKTDGDNDESETHYCHGCKRIIKINKIYSVLGAEASEKQLEYLQGGVKINQYRPSYFSGFTNEKTYIRSYDEFIALSWIKNFMQGNEHDGEFLHFKYSKNNEMQSILNSMSQGVIVAQYTIRHWVIAFVWGDVPKVLGLIDNEKQ